MMVQVTTKRSRTYESPEYSIIKFETHLRTATVTHGERMSNKTDGILQENGA